MLRALLALSTLALLAGAPRAAAAEPLPGVGYDRTVAVVVGISAQESPWEPLPNAARDAGRFAALLAARDVAVIELYDAQATRKAILDAITRQAPAALGDDASGEHRNLLIVYFAGHGHTVGDETRREAFLVPYGATGRADWISMRDLDGLHTLSSPFRHQLFVLSSCFGGELLRNGSPVSPKTRMKRLARNDAASRWLARGLSKVARVGLTAGDAGQKVADGPVGQGSQFGNALVNALESPGGSQRMAADFNEDGCVSSLELAAFVEGRGRTPYNSPRAGTLYGDDQGTIALCGQRFAKAPPLKTAGVRLRGGLPDGFVAVPAGSFVMGSPEGEEGRSGNEGPQHRVTFTRPLWVQTHEVTQAEWKRLMGSSPSSHADCDACPVEQVNWYEAAAYANARSRSEGLAECYTLKGCGEGERGGGCAHGEGYCGAKTWRCDSVDFAGLTCEGYRLPTEAEWEYFARASTTTRYSGGDDEAALAKAGWYDKNSGGATHAVGGKAANPWGLYDVHGNVWEWCNDYWKRDYSAEPVTDPLGPPSSRNRVARGGSFVYPARWARSANRYYLGPLDRFRVVGFRLVRAPRAP